MSPTWSWPCGHAPCCEDAPHFNHELHAFVGITPQRVLMRVFGILLAAIAVQSVFNGIKGSGLLA